MTKLITALKITVASSVAFNIFLQIHFDVDLTTRLAVACSALAVWALGGLTLWAHKKGLLV